MKKLIFTLLLAVGSVAAFAQCGKTVVLKSSETRKLSANGDVVDTKPETAEVVISPTKVHIVPGDDPVMEGEVKSVTCDWKTPFKEGKMVVSTHLKRDDGNEFDATITIEGKDGKVMLTFESPDMQGMKVQITADSFVEKS